MDLVDEKDSDVLSFGHAKFKEDMKIIFSDPCMFDKSTMHERLTNTELADKL